MGVFGDLPTRLLMRGLNGVPWFLEPLFVPPWTLVFFLMAKSQRRAVDPSVGPAEVWILPVESSL